MTELSFGRQLFIGKICHVTVETLRHYCEKFGSISDLSINRDKEENIYHCFAFVTFQSGRSVNEFMSKRPHKIHDEEIFVKRALTRTMATIPERLVVTNRLVVSNANQFSRSKLQEYLKKFGSIRNFDYENGLIDFDDYDPLDCLIISRPHYLDNEQIRLTKIIPTEADREENFQTKFEDLKKKFEKYQNEKERELKSLRDELKRIKDEIFDVTQVKLDKILKNQQILLEQFPSSSSTSSSSYAQMCRDFLEANSTKKRKNVRES